MSSYCPRGALWVLCLIAITGLAACAAGPAAKVRCDTNLRPINPPQPERP